MTLGKAKGEIFSQIRHKIVVIVVLAVVLAVDIGRNSSCCMYMVKEGVGIEDIHEIRYLYKHSNILFVYIFLVYFSFLVLVSCNR